MKKLILNYSLAFFVIFTLVGLLGVLSLSTVKVSALSGSSFNPGRIIDESVFKNETAMSPSQIQSFLNSKVPVCDTNGTQPYAGTTRAAYGASRGNPAPYTCLKDYSENVRAVSSSEGYCTGSTTSGTKSAAQIIYDVARACDINPQVLLVMLQKEQSLITDDWPWNRQYEIAMGYGCPDTAPCDEDYYGFFNQVWQAANAFERYAANPSWYNYRAGRNNNVYYHPDLSRCGSSTVFIENQPTAGLYIYTPYQPNQAALDNLYNTGDSCSSYGNRNFWRMFNDWFGSTTGDASYTWSIESQTLFSNLGRTQLISNHPTIEPAQTVYATVKAKNTGNQTWYKYNFRLSTNNPKNKASILADSSWITNNRAARLEEETVRPGETGTFTFSMTAPREPGVYKEYLLPVTEYVAWLNDWGMYYTLKVVAPSNYLHVKNLRTTLYTDEARTKKIYNGIVGSNRKIYAKTNFENGGVATFSSQNTRLATANPRDSTSIYKDDSWLSNNRVANIVSSTQSGKTATINWSFTSPSNQGSFNEDFAIVADGISWFDYSQNKVSLNVLEGEFTSLNALDNHTLKTGEFLYSEDGLYKLVLQSDGNLVLYKNYTPVWDTKTNSSKPNKLVLQSDGNLVLYKNYTPVWDR